ncbi:MAG TPA: Na+/H+ antiporter NhaA, partial [Ilumatobacteraceae bacterium]|nr:Na+/H+ antiporter NhaA [Ilumatobacteraceae bacterium]
IKREIGVGQLRDRRAVGLPVIAALGGMIVPALIFTAFNAGGPGADGWGIPMATDIAFALGVVTLLGSRVPPSVKVLLLTLAIADDIGAIVVIALFYSDDLAVGWLVAAVAITALVIVMRRVGVVHPLPFVAAGLALWAAVYESGIHATIAGVVMGLTMPARPAVDGGESPCDRLIGMLHPWTSFVVVPLFALANAGIGLSVDAISDPSSVLVGVAVALVVGKLIGVVGFSWLAVRVGIGRLPAAATWRHIVGVGALAGIGFTVSLFITGLAFDAPTLQADAKVGIFGASIVAALAGAAVFASARDRGVVSTVCHIAAGSEDSAR